MFDISIMYTMVSLLPCVDPSPLARVTYQTPVSDLHPSLWLLCQWLFFPHFIELKCGLVRTVPQIRYLALESHRESVKP